MPYSDHDQNAEESVMTKEQIIIALFVGGVSGFFVSILVGFFREMKKAKENIEEMNKRFK